MTSRKYIFNWDIIGDIDEGRPNLGNTVRVELYRLMQYTFRDIMEQKLGTEKADEIFLEAGKLAGTAFFDRFLVPHKDLPLNSFFAELQRILKEIGVGILRIEEASPEDGKFVLTVSEDLDCSGLPDLGIEVCTYDEGFISGIFEKYTGLQFNVKEVDCWCTGDRTCRFSIDKATP
ncbi:MAG: V4R domain-containing protein [Thermoguttaceae bacterium]